MSLPAVTETQRRLVRDAVVRPMIDLYGPRYADSPEAAAGAARQYEEDLAEFPQAVLEAAWQRVRRSHAGKQWPAIPALRAACLDAQAAADAARARKVAPRAKGRDWDGIRARRDAFLRVFAHTPLALQAKAEGWWNQLESRVKGIAWYQAQILDRWDNSDLVNPHADIRRYPDLVRRDFYLDDLALQNAITAPLSERDIQGCIERARSQEASFRARPKAMQSVPLPSVTRDALERAPAPVKSAGNYAEPMPEGGPVGPEPPPADTEFAPGAGPVS